MNDDPEKIANASLYQRAALMAEVDRLRAEIERLRAENKRLRAALCIDRCKEHDRHR